MRQRVPDFTDPVEVSYGMSALVVGVALLLVRWLRR
jgi:hypothetical protein